ncbi:putative transporter svop-1 [Patiria miniata]|uniref:Major facilitator superfamily (MFS) profile domain-containing protein n=1 Tax=Patiria miniata TaxID=46514 RepID=A0A914A8F4_PATMI|nr:putative transporter svop-1 [Patiria miniata]
MHLMNMASEASAPRLRGKTGEKLPLKDSTTVQGSAGLLDEAEAALKMLEYGSNSSWPKTTSDAAEESGDYSVNDAIDAIGVGWLQITILIMSFLAMLAVFAQILLSTTINEILRCTLKLSDDKVALISTMLFVGELLGTYPISKLMDTYGRRPGLILITCLMFFYSAIVSIAPNYVWVLILRLIAGIFVVGVQSSFMLYLGEITPSSFRALFVLGQVLFFGIGSVYVATLGYLVLPVMGWRFQCLFAAMPILPVMVAAWIFPESPRYYALTGSLKSAVETMKKIAAGNNKELPEGKLIQATIRDKEERSSVFQLLSPELSRQTLMLWIIWFCVYFCYLGIALSSGRLIRITSPLPPTAGNESLNLDIDPNSTLFIPPDPVAEGVVKAKPENVLRVATEDILPDHPHPRMTAPTCAEEDKEPVECEVIVSNSEYVDSVVASFGDFMAAPCIVVLVYTFGRKGGMSISLLLAASFMLCIIVTLGQIPPLVFIFLSRALTMGTYGGLFLYTMEAYPTSTRAIALATGQFFAKMAGALTPFVAESLIKRSPVDAILIYFFVCITGSITVCLLPLETQGMGLKDS